MATKRSDSNTIYQFWLAASDVVQITLPEGGEILNVGDEGDIQKPRLHLSVKISTAAGVAAQVRTFAVYEYGQPMWDCEQKYLGSAILNGVQKHVFELFGFTYEPGTLSVG